MNFFLAETWFQPISLSISKIQNSSSQTINKFERQPVVNSSLEKEDYSKIRFSLKKPFIKSDEYGWSWHKSWNIPTIHMEIDPVIKKKYGISKVGVFMLMRDLVGKTNKTDFIEICENSHKIEDLSAIKDGSIQFSALKFKTTSFSNNGENFFLLACFFNKNESSEELKIALSYISPPIFVDSREAAIKKTKNNYKEISKFIDPFLPDTLYKDMIKRENRSIKSSEKIDNTLEGFYHYLSAPNIRYKVKHPLFFLFKFPNVFRLYGKKSEIKNTEKEIIKNFQSNIISNYLNSSEEESNISANFILQIRRLEELSKAKKQKIYGIINILRSFVIKIIIEPNELNSNEYSEIKANEKIIFSYKQAYPELMSEKLKMFSKRKITSAEYDNANYEIQVKKKMKQEPIEILKIKKINTQEREHDDKRPFYKMISEDSKKIEVIFNTNCKFAQEIGELELKSTFREKKCEKESILMEEANIEARYENERKAAYDRILWENLRRMNLDYWRMISEFSLI